jgi:DNA mismatch endonuclease, patch repair protein
VVEAKLRSYQIDGWAKHVSEIPGTPDFFFPAVGLALFVDGCFWHGCPKCDRRLPGTNRKKWAAKITANVRRDNRQRRQLNRLGFHVMRVREHSFRDDSWVTDSRATLSDYSRNEPRPRLCEKRVVDSVHQFYIL